MTGIKIMYAILCYLAGSILGNTNAMDLNELIRRHEQGLGLLRSIKAKVELSVSEDGGKTWKKTLEYSILRNGAHERYTARYRYAPTSGYADGEIRPTNSQRDVLTTPEGRRSIVYTGLTPEEAPAGDIDIGELETSGKSISGQIDPPQPFGPHGYKSPWLTPVLFLADQRFTLKELCAGSNPRPAERRDDQGRSLYDLTVWDPTRVRRYSFSFDPAHGYLIHSLKIEDAKGKPIEWFGQLSVVDYQEPKEGLFLPRTIRGSSVSNGERLYQVIVSDVTANEPFEDETLHRLDFPPGIVVLDTTRGNAFHLWGEGKPAMTFQSLDEFRRWKLEKMGSYVRRVRHGGWSEKAFWMIGATAVLAIVLGFRRRFLRRLDHSESMRH